MFNCILQNIYFFHNKIVLSLLKNNTYSSCLYKSDCDQGFWQETRHSMSVYILIALGQCTQDCEADYLERWKGVWGEELQSILMCLHAQNTRTMVQFTISTWNVWAACKVACVKRLNALPLTKETSEFGLHWVAGLFWNKLFICSFLHIWVCSELSLWFQEFVKKIFTSGSVFIYTVENINCKRMPNKIF